MASLPMSICRIDTPDGIQDCVTILDDKLVFARGLPSEAIVGILVRPLGPGEAITAEIFSRNRGFVDYMHALIARRGPELPGLIAEATRQGDGFVFVIDQRTPTPRGAVPPEDIVGAFEVKGGQVVSGSYRPSPNHRLLTSNGFFQLGPELQPCLLLEVTALAMQDSEPGAAT